MITANEFIPSTNKGNGRTYRPQTDKQTDRQTDRETNKQTDRQTDKQTRRTDGRTDRYNLCKTINIITVIR